ncbi:MAG: hypothetical protein IT354_11725 [Gemmatimonadaceae bacterium]|nr:hypothetical protein [Gemmatimonadaceae bacterium]
MARAQAAARPLGASLVDRPGMSGAAVNAGVAAAAGARAGAAGVPAGRSEPTPASFGQRAARETRDQRIVVGLVSVFVIMAVALMGMSLATSTRESRAKDQLNATFANVHTQQSEYRALFGRFASWPELKARGAEVGPRQTVRGWNADASHWFISIRDRETGLICDRTGELFDEDAAERAPVCRSIK